MSVIVAVFTVTGALWWSLVTLAAVLYAGARLAVRRDRARQAARVVAHAEELLRDTAAGR